MFLERLSRISGRIDGAVALSLVAHDGMPVESVSSDSQIDLEVLAAELVSQLRAIGEQYRELSVGNVHHFAITTDRQTFMVNEVADGYYLLLVLGPQASYGRARFEMRRARLLFERDLT